MKGKVVQNKLILYVLKIQGKHFKNAYLVGLGCFTQTTLCSFCLMSLGQRSTHGNSVFIFDK